jgi:hypothetical protein
MLSKVYGRFRSIKFIYVAPISNSFHGADYLFKPKQLRVSIHEGDGRRLEYIFDWIND